MAGAGSHAGACQPGLHTNPHAPARCIGWAATHATSAPFSRPFPACGGPALPCLLSRPFHPGNPCALPNLVGGAARLRDVPPGRQQRREARLGHRHKQLPTHLRPPHLLRQLPLAGAHQQLEEEGGGQGAKHRSGIFQWLYGPQEQGERSASALTLPSPPVKSRLAVARSFKTPPPSAFPCSTWALLTTCPCAPPAPPLHT
jgi:hypothetical protein